MDRWELRPSGMVDELWSESTELTVERTGDARLVLTLDSLRVRLWTTRRARVSVQLDGPLPPWVELTTTPPSLLVRLRTARCAVHLEQMDRAGYWLGLHRDPDDRVGLHLRAGKYLHAVLERPT